MSRWGTLTAYLDEGQADEGEADEVKVLREERAVPDQIDGQEERQERDGRDGEAWRRDPVTIDNLQHFHILLFHGHSVLGNDATDDRCLSGRSYSTCSRGYKTFFGGKLENLDIPLSWNSKNRPF